MSDLNRMTVTKLGNLFTVPAPAGRQQFITDRAYYAFSFCRQGEMIYTHNGQEFVSNKSCIILLPKNGTYCLYCNKSGVFPVIDFDCADFASDTFRIFPIESPESYWNDFEAMRDTLLVKNNRPRALRIFYSFLERLAAEQQTVPRVLEPAMKYLETHYADPALTNQVLADCCHISEAHFREVFRQSCGVTPKQYILELRMEKAKLLLPDHVLSVGQIAEQCGFSNPYHFCRSFRAMTGMTPTDYRRANRKLML